MVSLAQVKEALNIDHEDQDQYLMILLAGAIRKAELSTGRNYSNKNGGGYEEMPADIQKAVIQVVATDYAVRDDIGADGANSTSDNGSIYTFRQNSKNPMF